MKTFFIADLHFGHANCIKYDERPWETVEEMDADLIRLWNGKVRPEDHVYVLGDFAYRSAKPADYYAKQLNGYIHLICGNHDNHSEESEKCFCEVTDYKELTIPFGDTSCRLVLSHYFIPFYRGARRGAIMLHGHTHKTEESALEEMLKEEIRRMGFRCEAFNVGCTWQNYEPQTLEEIIARQDREIDLG